MGIGGERWYDWRFNDGGRKVAVLQSDLLPLCIAFDKVNNFPRVTGPLPEACNHTAFRRTVTQ